MNASIAEELELSEEARERRAALHRGAWGDYWLARIDRRLGEALIATGDYDTAIDRLETLMSIPYSLTVTTLRLHPEWAPLRDHTRFQALVERYDRGAG